MPTAYYEGDPQNVVHNRDGLITIELYDPDGDTAMQIDGANDNVLVKIWSVDGAAAAIECESETPGTSYVDIVSNGTAGVTPATINVFLAKAATATLVVGTQYYGEVVLVDDSDASKEKSLGKFPITIIGTAAD